MSAPSVCMTLCNTQSHSRMRHVSVCTDLSSSLTLCLQVNVAGAGRAGKTCFIDAIKGYTRSPPLPFYLSFQLAQRFFLATLFPLFSFFLHLTARTSPTPPAPQAATRATSPPRNSRLDLIAGTQRTTRTKRRRPSPELSQPSSQPETSTSRRPLNVLQLHAATQALPQTRPRPDGPRTQLDPHLLRNPRPLQLDRHQTARS